MTTKVESLQPTVLQAKAKIDSLFKSIETQIKAGQVNSVTDLVRAKHSIDQIYFAASQSTFLSLMESNEKAALEVGTGAVEKVEGDHEAADEAPAAREGGNESQIKR